MDSLGVRYFKNSVVYPTIRVASRPGRILMGVYDEADHYIEDTVLNRRSGERGAPVPRDLYTEVTDADTPEAIYAGSLYFHFGHFLLESLARTRYARRHPELPLVWAGGQAWKGRTLAPWQAEILEILGVTNPTRIIADPTRFELLHIPDIGYRYDDWFHPEHAEFLGRYEGPEQVPGRRLWLSRSKIDKDVRDLNAEPTERRLREAGWTVAHPELLTVREQLDHLSRAEVIAGEEGSAFHTLMLLRDVRSKRFHILRRKGREHRNMHTVGDMRQVNQTFHTLKNEVILKAEGRRVVTKINPSSAETLDVLRVPVPAPESEPAPPPEESRLARVLEGLAPLSLLDVGATGSHVIRRSKAVTRVAVSPRFDFDTRTYAADEIGFYELDLERYADVFHNDAGPFDAIRIAADDFDEFMHSFRVSRRLAHDATVWLFGSGELASRAALAVRLMHPGYVPRRVLERGKPLYVVQCEPHEPADEAAVGAMSPDEVSRRVRWIPPTSLGLLR